MKEWLLSITVIIILSIIILLILPEGKLYGLSKSIFSAMALITILSPIIDLNVFTDPIEFVFGEQEQVYQEDYLDYVFNIKVENIKKDCKKIIENNYSNNADIDIVFYRDNQFDLIIEKVNICFYDQSISEDTKRIIQEEISKYLSIEKAKIKFNG